MFCTSCGSQVADATSKHCSNCGKALPSGPPPAPQKRRVSAGRILLVIGAAVGLPLAALYLVLVVNMLNATGDGGEKSKASDLQLSDVIVSDVSLAPGHWDGTIVVSGTVTHHRVGLTLTPWAIVSVADASGRVFYTDETCLSGM